MREWLVEIRVDDWCLLPKDESRVVTYIEVLANNECAARLKAFDEFEVRCQYEPVTRRKMQQRNIKVTDCCAPDAVALD